MSYCETTFQAVPPERVEIVLSEFTKENFVGGRAAYQLDDLSFAIDAGINNIRAIYDEGNECIRFFCRYEREIEFYDKKLQSFASKHNIFATVISQNP